jgi:hypothetical protein
MEFERCVGVDEWGEFVFDYCLHWTPDREPSRSVCYDGPSEGLANKKFNFWQRARLVKV